MWIFIVNSRVTENIKTVKLNGRNLVWEGNSYKKNIYEKIKSWNKTQNQILRKGIKFGI